MSKKPTNTQTTPQQALLAIKEKKGEFDGKPFTWQDVADFVNLFSADKFDRSYLRRVALGKPASAKLCVALGVPAPQVLAPVCDKCGGRCLPKRCTAIPRKATPKPFKLMTNPDGKKHKVYLAQAGDVV